MRLLLLLFCLLSSAAFAVDIRSLGKPLDDDGTPMRDRYVYFNIEATGKNVPVDRAILSSTDIEDWLRQHITDALALNGEDYDGKTVTVKNYFTQVGYDAYIASLVSAALPQLLKEKNYALSAVVLDRPQIIMEGLRDLAPLLPKEKKQYQYVWQAKVPTLLSYTHGTEVLSYNALIEVEVVRVPLRDDGTKVALNAWRFGQSTPVEKPKNTLAPATEESAMPNSRFAF